MKGGHSGLPVEVRRLAEERTAAIELLADALGITEARAAELVRVAADTKGREFENHRDRRWGNRTHEPA